jgi:hypothetical protein
LEMILAMEGRLGRKNECTAIWSDFTPRFAGILRG